MGKKYKAPISDQASHRYQRVQIALMTGWSFDIIDELGFQDYMDIFTVIDVDNKLKNGVKPSKVKQ